MHAGSHWTPWTRCAERHCRREGSCQERAARRNGDQAVRRPPKPKLVNTLFSKELEAPGDGLIAIRADPLCFLTRTFDKPQR